MGGRLRGSRAYGLSLMDDVKLECGMGGYLQVRATCMIHDVLARISISTRIAWNYGHRRMAYPGDHCIYRIS